MNDVVVAFMHAAQAALSEHQESESRGPITLRDAALRVRMANRVTAQWQLILAEGCGWAALARDELSEVLNALLNTPIDAVVLAATMRSSPRCDGAMYPGRFPGIFAGFKAMVAKEGWLGAFHGWLPRYIAGFLEQCRPSQLVPEASEFGYDVEEDWTRVNNKAVREIMRWLAYTAAHPFSVVAQRMAYYGGADYATMLTSFRTILRNEGVTGLFKGHSVTMLQSFVSLLFGEQFVFFVELFPPLQLLQTRMALDTQRLQSPLAAASEIYAEGGFTRFMSGFKAHMWSLPASILAIGLSETILLLTFGFRKHSSPRTVPQRARTALRRWLFGEREEERQARVEEFKRKHGSARDLLKNKSDSHGNGSAK